MGHFINLHSTKHLDSDPGILSIEDRYNHLHWDQNNDADGDWS
jgi:hypothetical protein